MKAESTVLRVFKKMVVPSKVRYLESQFLPSAAGALFLGCFYNRNFGDNSFWFLWPTAQIFILIALAFIVFFAIRGVCAAVQTAHSGACLLYTSPAAAGRNPSGRLQPIGSAPRTGVRTGL